MVEFGLLDSKEKPTKILNMLVVWSLDSSDRAWRNLLASASLTVCPYIETGRGISASSHTGCERTEQAGRRAQATMNMGQMGVNVSSHVTSESMGQVR